MMYICIHPVCKYYVYLLYDMSCIYIYVLIVYIVNIRYVYMGWLRLVGSLKL